MKRLTKLQFSGWMFASSPAVSSLEHSVYDVTLWLYQVSEDIIIVAVNSRRVCKASLSNERNSSRNFNQPELQQMGIAELCIKK